MKGSLVTSTRNGRMSKRTIFRSDGVCGVMMVWAAVGASTAAMMACSSVTGDQALPSGTPNPSSFNSVDGAIGMRNAALYQFGEGLQRYSVDAGVLTDELSDRLYGTSAASSGGVQNPIDERIMPDGSGNAGEASYGQLQEARGAAMQALGALATYAASTPSAWRGELHAMTGYSETMLADLFCSGVPLSTLDFHGDYTYRAGSTTRETYAAALAQFDTAIAMAGDSVRILNLARVGKARVLLDMDSVAAAAVVAAAVPTEFSYTIAVKWSANGINNQINTYATVSDREGRNGLAYRSGGDPRTSVIVGDYTALGIPLYFPAKYATGATVPTYSSMIVASGTEARLIQAEAALRAGDYPTWIGLLNAPRRAVVIGEGATLDMLADPGPSPRDSARVALQFNERAMWFFVDGHRQGDLRRLVRNYHWAQGSVYPVGAYLAPGTGRYGSELTAPIPVTEKANPLFHGCIDRNA